MGSWDTSRNRTIGIDLWAHQVRGQGGNACTLAFAAARPHPQNVRREMRDMFLTAYRAVADRCRAIDEPGLAIIAVHETTGMPQGIVRLMARVERHVAAIVGRHDHADLYLANSENMALRQVAIILDPVKSWERGNTAVHYRLLDLRTSTGFSDEQGRPLRGLRCEGPALVRAAGHALFLLPVGDPTDWPVRAEDAWDCLPERVYFDELARRPDGSFTHMPRIVQHRRRSVMIRTVGPHDTSRSFATGQRMVAFGPAAGILEIEGPRITGAIEIGNDELRDGILLGRYERCANAALADDNSLSRVHALMIQIDDRLLVVDTCSINGTRIPGQHRGRVFELGGDTELQLGKATRMRWRYVS
ncbi:MAG TPA: FHA domain-containing protein [Kofleriaceae bacterium]|nr:FHA domain-containing protein [Kofleriaceae bacterium]